MKTGRKIAGMSIGSATLVMVFSILCLSIFAVLTVVTAQNEWTLARKNAQAVENYYAADTKAVEQLDQIEKLDDGEYLDYRVPIDDKQSLWVQLLGKDNQLIVTRWEVEENRDWEVDQSLNVWQG